MNLEVLLNSKCVSSKDTECIEPMRILTLNGTWNTTDKFVRCAKISKETKTLLSTYDTFIYASTFDNGEEKTFSKIMPVIAGIDVINDKVVVVYFGDGTCEKSVVDGDDVFSVEQGLSICITKKILSLITDGKSGGSIYNKIVGLAMDFYKSELNHIAKRAEKEKRDNEIKINKVNKAKQRKEKRIAAEREAQIEIQKEAYLRAMREINKQ